jgi:hypothetical protein
LHGRDIFVPRAGRYALESKKIKKLPVKPRRVITHLMAKAAVAVYEGVVEGKEG